MQLVFCVVVFQAMESKLLLPSGSPETNGDMSLQLSLAMALQSFAQSVPSFATQQVVLIHSSLRTIDRMDVFATIEELREKKVCVCMCVCVCVCVCVCMCVCVRVCACLNEFPSRASCALPAQIKCSVISLVGELHVAVQVAALTGGRFTCVTSEDELQHQLSLLTMPPPVLVDSATKTVLAEMMQWGFPRQAEGHAVCACHLEDCFKG
jgi:hypothetical protein